MFWRENFPQKNMYVNVIAHTFFVCEKTILLQEVLMTHLGKNV